jgi:hypothetical protein
MCDRPSGAVAMQNNAYSPGVTFASVKDSIFGAIAPMPPPLPGDARVSIDGAGPLVCPVRRARSGFSQF